MILSPYRHAVAGGASATFTYDGVTAGDPASGDGVIHYLGTDGDTNTFTNPHGKSTGVGGYTAAQSSNESASTTAEKASDKGNGSGEFSQTDNPQADPIFWRADFGADRTFEPTHFGFITPNAAVNMPKTLYFEGSNNGSTWTTLGSRNTSTSADTWYVHAVTATEGYRYLRIRMAGGGNNGFNDHLCLGDVEFWGTLHEV